METLLDSANALYISASALAVAIAAFMAGMGIVKRMMNDREERESERQEAKYWADSLEEPTDEERWDSL